MCPAWNLQISATASGGTGPYSYLWTGSGAANLSATNIYNPTFSACPVGNYSLTCTVTDALSATSSATTIIHIVDDAPEFISCVPDITKCGSQNISWLNVVPDISEIRCPSCPWFNATEYWVDNGPWVWQTFHAGKTGLLKSLSYGLLNCDHLPFTIQVKLFPGEPDSLVDAQYPNTCPIFEYDTTFTVAGGTANGIYTIIIPDNVAPYMQAGSNWYTLCLSGIGSYNYNAWLHGWWLSPNSCTNPNTPDPMPGGGTYGFYDYEGTQQPPGYYHTYHLAFNTVIAQIPGLSVTDGCAVKTLVSSIPSGSFFNNGTTPVTYTATNSGGNTSQCSFNVTINNTSLPAAPVSLGDKTACAPPQNLKVSVPTDCTADWYSAAVGGVLLLSGNVTYTATAAGTYWAEARFISGGCTSGTRTPVTLCIPTLLISNPAAVCSPGPVNLTDPSITAGSLLCSGILSYWKNPAGTTPLANPNNVTAANTYYIKLTAGACSIIQPVVVRFYLTPSLVIHNPAAVCSPNTMDLTAAAVTAGSSLTDATLSYWTDAGATIPLANPNAVAVSGTYYIKALTSDNCVDIKPVLVTITPLNTINLSSAVGTNNQTVCINTAITNIRYSTTGATGATYSGLPTGVTGAWAASVVTISGTPSVSGTFNYTVTLTGGCGTITANGTITVNPIAAVTSVTGTSPLCIGATATYTANGVVLGGGTGAWSSSNTAIATVIAGTGVVTAVGAGTCDIIYTITGGCGGTKSKQKSLTVTPNASIASVTGTTPLCIGATATYTTTGVVLGGGTGAWSSSNTTVATVIAGTGVVTAVGAGTCNIIYSITGGCGGTASAQQSLTVNPNAAVTSVTGTTPLCIGATATYTANGVVLGGGTGAWSSSNTAVATVIAGTGVVTAVGVGTCNIIYTITGGCGGTKSAQQSLTVTPNAAVASVIGATPLCIGGTATYTTTGVVLGGGTGTWSSSDISVATVNAGTGVVTAVGAGICNIIYTITGGCGGTVSAQQLLTVTAVPTAIIFYPGSPFCTSLNTLQPVTLNGTGTYLGGTYAVAPAGLTIDASTGSITPNTSTPGTYTVTYTIPASGGCSAVPVTTTVTITVIPTAAISYAGNPFCISISTPQSVTLAGTGAYLGGTYSASPAGLTINSSTGAITPGTSTPGTYIVSYTIPTSGGCSAVPVTTTVTINPLLAPAITGPASVCAGSTGNMYTTQAGNSNYIWTVSAGGTITSGGGTGNNTVMVTWNTAGAQSVSVNYNNTYGCAAATPVVYNVTVNALPVPFIFGPTESCQYYVTYNTPYGNTGYTWSISPGNSIISNGGNSVMVNWVVPGAQWISVNYTNAYGCTAASPTVLPVNVHAQTTPTLTGPATVCKNSTANVYTTQAGMTNYVWNIPVQGTITSGGGPNDNTVTITWHFAGTYTILFSFDDANGCSPLFYSSFDVTVNSLPVPSLAGPSSVCQNSTANVYTTAAGKTNYVWSVSAGGTITSGGGTGDNTVTVTWNTAGAQSVSVNYTNASGCTAAPFVYNVTVNALPTPTIVGPVSVCANSTGNVYTTTLVAGHTYSWTISGGVITAGAGTTSITVTWGAAGAGWVQVTETITATSCAVTTAHDNVTINPLPTCSITGADQLCPFSTGNIFTVSSGMSSYTWSISGNGSISGLVNGLSVTVSAGSNCNSTFTLSVTITDSHGCVSSCSKSVLVQDLTPPAITSCPSSITTLADLSQPYATISLPPPVYSDNCTAIANISVSWTMTAPTAGSGIGMIPVPFHFNIGTTTVTYTITDACGNASTCSFNITVASNFPPVITCPASINTVAVSGLCSAALDPGFPTLVSGTLPVTYSWIMTGATLGTGAGPILPNPHIFNVGVTTIIWRVTNIAGFAECTQNITVMDDQPPTFAAPTPKTYCVHQIDSAFYWNPTMDIKPDRPEYYIFKSGTTDLNLNPSTFADNCPLNCDVEIRWRIGFADGSFLPPLPSLYITGQPSAYPRDIIFPGSASTNVIHTITYQIVDCHGNVSLPLTINITILLRPIVTKHP
jgi:hypothetical protein